MAKDPRDQNLVDTQAPVSTSVEQAKALAFTPAEESNKGCQNDRRFIDKLNDDKIRSKRPEETRRMPQFPSQV